MKKILFPICLIITLSFLTIFKIHSSSIGVYHQYFYGNKKDPNLIFGQPRGIRSDEWLVVTPKTISQVKSGFPVINKNIGYGEVMPVQGCYPYKHWRVIFCPNVWSFFFLPLENAFSLYWWFPSLLMMLAIYFFSLYFFKDILLSIFSSLIFFFAPFNQWWSYWFSFYFGFALCFVLFFLKSLENKGIKSIFYLFISIYFFICFVFLLYPPFQVSSFYIFIAFTIGFLLSKKKIFDRKTIFFALILFFFTALLIGKFYFEFKEVINIIRNTEYPGKRFVANTIGNFVYLINGFYNIQLVDDVKGVGPFENQSEASNFFLLSLFALPVYWWVIFNQIRSKKIDWIFLMLNLVFILLLIWFLFPIPKLLAKISFLYLVPQGRSIIGIGIASYFLMFYFLSKIKIKKDNFYLFLVFICSILIFLVNLYLGFWFKFNYPVFIQNNLKIIIISFSSFLLLILLLTKKKLLFMLFILLFSFIYTFKVNPIYKGLGSILNTELSYFLNNKIFKDKNKDKRFAVYHSIYLTNYLIANGIKSINATYYHPQEKIIKILDPLYKNIRITNRYGYLGFFFDKNNKSLFVLHSLDNFSININPCDSRLKKLDIKYILAYPNFNFSCLKIIKMIDNSHFIYEIE